MGLEWRSFLVEKDKNLSASNMRKEEVEKEEGPKEVAWRKRWRTYLRTGNESLGNLSIHRNSPYGLFAQSLHSKENLYEKVSLDLVPWSWPKV